MRLTLRTLLAYMDDILEPADHEDLGKKIEASDFATELIHRSRDTVRRLRLGAPSIASDASDDVLDSVDLSDANSVAEYLDNTLPPEQVADFERMCLESGTQSDMHLAEVASCHHVLTMVLGEPAEVDADLKKRIYELPAKLASGQKLRVETAHAAPQEPPPVREAPPVAAAPPVAQPVSSLKPELPDYLREAAAAKRSSRRWAIAMTLLAGAALTAFWFSTAPEAEPPAEVALSGADAFDGEIEIEGIDDPTLESMTSNATDEGVAPPFVPGVPPAESPATTELEAAPAFEPATSAPAPPATTDAPPTTADLPEAELSKPGTSETELLEMDLPETELPDTEIVGAEDTAPAARVAATTPPQFPATLDRADDPATGAVADREVGTATAADMQDEQPSATVDTIPGEVIVVAPAGPRRLGNYLGNNDVLLIYSPVQEKWIRMPPRSPITTGDALLTLPKFRTHVVLADVNVYLGGGTRVYIPEEMFESLTNQAELNLEMVYGRLLLNAGLQGSQTAMKVGEQLREFKLASSSSLAVDVQRVFVPGNDYENEVAPIRASWYLTSGTVEWPTAAGGSQTIAAPAMWKTIDGIDEIPERIEQLPAWIDRELMTDMERSARDDIAQELKFGQPVTIRLLELTEGKGLGRRKEVRVLAAASSTFVGEFVPLVQALNNSDQNRAWDTHIRDLRQSMALSPDVATNIREAFISTRGEEAAEDLMELVSGYNRDQVGRTREEIQTGVMAQLLKWLDHESLDYRVLAINNIREITGKSKGYRPDDPVKRRKIQLRKFYDEFEANELVPQA